MRQCALYAEAIAVETWDHLLGVQGYWVTGTARRNCVHLNTRWEGASLCSLRYPLMWEQSEREMFVEMSCPPHKLRCGQTQQLLNKLLQEQKRINQLPLPMMRDNQCVLSGLSGKENSQPQISSQQKYSTTAVGWRHQLRNPQHWSIQRVKAEPKIP